MRFCFVRNGGDEGIALIFVMGILVLAMAIIAGFTAVSRIERKNLENYAALQSARMAAMTGLQRALLGIQIYAGDYNPGRSLDDIYSYDPDATDDTVYSEYLQGDTGLITDTVNGEFYSIPVHPREPSSYPVWNYLVANSVSGTVITGRVAYKVFSSSGKFDLSACLDSGFNALASNTTAATECCSGAASRTSTDIDGSPLYGRRGNDVSEIFLSCMDSCGSWIGNPDYLSFISSNMAEPRGELPAGGSGRWNDMDTLFASLGISTVRHEETRNLFQRNFLDNNPPDPEAFWYDADNDNIQTPDELYNRFNISRNDWDNVTVDQLVNGRYSVFDSADTDGVTIPWIKCWQSPGDSQDSATMRKQIAANLINYCSASNAALTDDPDSPTYTGLVKSSYINEMKLHFLATLSASAGKTSWSFHFSLQLVDADIELVNMYDTPCSSRVSISIDCQMQDELCWPAINNPCRSFIQAAPTIKIDSRSPLTTPPRSYAHILLPYKGPSLNVTSGYPDQVYSRIENIKFNRIGVKLTDPTGTCLQDFSFLAAPGYPYDSGVVLSRFYTAPSASADFYVDFQVSDPRQNLNPQDWTPSSGDSTIGTIGRRNSCCNPDPGGCEADPEPGAIEPWQVSSAYIRNGPMKSPWELGLIHRGRKWQTLNLKKYDMSKGPAQTLISGGGDYSAGDANILDQVKTTSAANVYGKVNLNNSLDTAVFQALFANIMVGANQAGQGIGSDTVRATDANGINHEAYALASAVKTFSLSTPQGLLTRAQVVNADVFTNIIPAAQTADSSMEEVIGKFINLTKADKSDNVFTVISIGQAIRKSRQRYVVQRGYDPSTDGVISTQKITAVVQRNPATGQLSIVSMKYSK